MMWEYPWFLLVTKSQVLWFVAYILSKRNTKFQFETGKTKSVIFPIQVPGSPWILSTPELNDM